MTSVSGDINLVIKLGGGLLASPEHFADALAAIAIVAGRRRLVLVPGGGPFAEAIREVDRHLGLGDDEAHWMAVLAMDQYAHLIAARLERGVLVRSKAEAHAALDAGQIPVLAPYAWLREADPLPHSWDVTSDSLAAWITGEVGARELVLIKPPDASEPFVDEYFSRALPEGVTSTVLAAGTPLRSALEAC